MAAGSSAQAGENSNESGYRDCNLQHLEACQNTNQMFFGWRGADGSHSFRKPELPATIQKFLRGAPVVDTLGHSFSAADVVEESLTGPGERFKFSTGEWFFTGFTPHFALDQGAIIFDTKGHILMIAILGPDMSIPPKAAYGGYRCNLTIYLHAPQPDDRFVEHVIHWAGNSISDRSKTYPELPHDEMGTTTIVTASPDLQRWNKRIL